MKKQSHFKYLSVRVFFFVAIHGLFTFCLIIFIPRQLVTYHYLLLVILYGMLSLLVFLGYRLIYIPYRETTKIMQLFATNYTVQDIFEIRHPVNYEFEAMMKKIQKMFDTQKLIGESKRQAQYLALQNQINPHFLYNTLEGIRGEAIAADMVNVAEMTEALATFFRYTISNVENFVTLEDELHNVQNYFLIQKYRFGERLRLNTDCDPEDREEVYKCQIPKLTLQPIVENAIIHGIEQNARQGSVNIKIETTAKRLLITISDNGVGISPEQLNQLNNRLNALSYNVEEKKDEKRSGIALVNVNNRIKLLFGEEYGITVYSTLSVGTDVNITLPYLKQGVVFTKA